ncbi:hypothetical protein [Ureibacillus chungkukjangi]|uniref:hypothetical protein n=1 Tax=Ureibacillus chungkukjangi TaxID=1202712 RepID=UPI0015E8D4CE|nr:hypothetical protein [Ureibacillus chungkukjangi]MCM3387863.1 hypothetical protein [Ureibacillus chungkukjangi]
MEVAKEIKGNISVILDYRAKKVEIWGNILANCSKLGKIKGFWHYNRKNFLYFE